MSASGRPLDVEEEISPPGPSKADEGAPLADSEGAEDEEGEPGGAPGPPGEAEGAFTAAALEGSAPERRGGPLRDAARPPNSEARGRNPRLKQRPQDFQVREVVDLPEEGAGAAAAAGGEKLYFLHRLTKKKLTTPEAIGRIARRFNVQKSDIAYGGLKDKQSLSTQIISIKGRAIDWSEPGLHLAPIGRRDRPITSEDVKANQFKITVRGLGAADLCDLDRRLDEVRAFGFPNYFDSQRFGSARFGQGFLARELVRGDPESALRLFMATPSPHDHSRDKYIKRIIAERWGDWDGLSHRMRASPYGRILGHLAHAPGDFWGAVGYMSRPLRALHLFAYQSLIWNNSAIFYLRRKIAKARRFTVPYQCGRLVFYRSLEPAAFEALRETTIPLVGPETRPEDPEVRAAVARALETEGVSVEAFRLPEAAGGFFREEPRKIVCLVSKLEAGAPEDDELNPGKKKVVLSFELPRGAYGTLLVKRLFRG
jgi:tRNA pseudouridine13 synthase